MNIKELFNKKNEIDNLDKKVKENYIFLKNYERFENLFDSNLIKILETSDQK
jgi:hypothetical protein